MDPKSLCINCGESDKKIHLGYGIEKVTEEIKKWVLERKTKNQIQ